MLIARPPLEVSSAALAWVARTARRAGLAALEFYGAGGAATTLKSDASPVTAADLAAHGLIVSELEAWAPEVPVVSEEGEPAPYAVRRSWERFWLVDPLDGTKEFLARNGEFTTNIALVAGGEPVLGVVHAPALGLTYYAARGLGAWKQAGDGTPERIRSAPAARGARLRVVESRSHPSPELEAFLGWLPVAERIRIGSSLKFCLLAEGRADLYPRLGPTCEWDTAAGDCIFRHSGAGGERRSPLRYNKPELRNDAFVIGFA